MRIYADVVLNRWIIEANIPTVATPIYSSGRMDNPTLNSGQKA